MKYKFGLHTISFFMMSINTGPYAKKFDVSDKRPFFVQYNEKNEENEKQKSKLSDEKNPQKENPKTTKIVIKNT